MSLIQNISVVSQLQTMIFPQSVYCKYESIKFLVDQNRLLQIEKLVFDIVFHFVAPCEVGLIFLFVVFHAQQDVADRLIAALARGLGDAHWHAPNGRWAPDRVFPASY